MDYITILGLIAGGIGSIQFAPQVVKIYKTKKARDLSYYSIFMSLLTNVLWLTYGCLRQDIAIIVTNIALFIMIVTLILFKFKYDKLGN